MEEDEKIYIIPGNPIPWKRPGSNGKRRYDSQKDQKANFVNKFLKKYFIQPTKNPISLGLMYHIPIPPSITGKRRLERLHSKHILKPDIDNLNKFLQDAFKGIIWHDDCQIYEYRQGPKKIWCNEKEGATVMIVGS